MNELFSVIVPAYNEETTLEANIKAILDVVRPLGDFEVIIVDESTDSTPEIAAQLSSQNTEVVHVQNIKRLGKGGAIEKGIQKTRGEKIIFIDADLETGLDEFAQMFRALDSHDIVIGSRFHPDSVVKRPAYRKLLSKCLGLILRILFGIPLIDTQCGFKGFRRDVILEILPTVDEKGWFWDVQLLYYARKLGYCIHTIPVHWQHKRESSYDVPANTFYHLKSILSFFLRTRRL